MLKRIRNNSAINRFFRNLLKKCIRIFTSLTYRWPVSGTIELEFRNKKIVYFARCDDGIVDTFFYERNYIEFPELNLFSHIAEHSKTIVDIGANTGLYSIISSLFNPQANIFAFEPGKANLERLEKNISLNKLENIQTIGQAIGDSVTTISFTVPDNGMISDTCSALGDFSRSMYEGNINWIDVEVPQTTLNEFSKKAGRVDLMKIDVEGYEINVFKGATDFFKKHSPVILCEIFLDGEKQAYFEDFLKTNQYYAYQVLKEGLLRLDEGLAPNYDGLNFLFSRNKTAHVFTSFKHMEQLVAELMG